jgi:glycerol-3-phosphate dehydrogenase (NAD(P)+)
MSDIPHLRRDVAIIGAGSWGTALAISLASAGHRVRLWARSQAAAEQMERLRHNPTYLPDAILPSSIHVTSDLVEATADTRFWVFATPSQSVRGIAMQMDSLASKNVTVVSVAKGIENDTLMTTTQVMHDVFNIIPEENLGVLYGPSHAEEVAAGVPTAVVAAARSLDTAKLIQEVFSAPRMRVYVNTDLVGVEIAGSVKNVLAIATGIVEGIGFGDNAKAALITRGLAEIQRLGTAMGGQSTTFSGLAGIGDIVVTCTSKLSRNRYVGEQIGLGRTLAEIEAEMSMVAEGVRTTQSVCELARQYKVEMPITSAVHAILFEGKEAHIAIEELMARAAKIEDWLPHESPGASG